MYELIMLLFLLIITLSVAIYMLAGRVKVLWNEVHNLRVYTESLSAYVDDLDPEYKDSSSFDEEDSLIFNAEDSSSFDEERFGKVFEEELDELDEENNK